MLLEFLRHASHDLYDYELCVLLAHDCLNDEVSRLGIPNISLNMRGYWDVSVWWKLYRCVRRNPFDLIRTYGLKADIIGRIVAQLAGIPVHITSVRSTDPWRKWYHVWLDRLTSSLTQVYVSNSEAGRLAVHQREHIPLSKIVTIPNGIDLTIYDPTRFVHRDAALRYRHEFQIPPQTPVLGIISNLCKMKGHSTLVDAMPHIQREFPDVRCLFVGTDFLHGTLQAYVRQRHLEQNVLFTGFRDDIPELLTMLDIVLLPSLWEGFPTAVLEAMAMQKPMIATAVGGIPEIIEHGRTGLLIPPEDPVSLAEAVVFLLKQPDVAVKLGQAACETVRQNFSIQGMVKQTEALYAAFMAKYPRKDVK